MNTELTAAVERTTGQKRSPEGFWHLDTDHGRLAIGLSEYGLHLTFPLVTPELIDLGVESFSGTWGIYRSAALPDVPAIAGELVKRLAKVGFVLPNAGLSGNPAKALKELGYAEIKPGVWQQQDEDPSPYWNFLGCTTEAGKVVAVIAAAMLDGCPVTVRWSTDDDGAWHRATWGTDLRGWAVWVPEGVPVSPPEHLLVPPGGLRKPDAWAFEARLSKADKWFPRVSLTYPVYEERHLRNVVPLFRQPGLTEEKDRIRYVLIEQCDHSQLYSMRSFATEETREQATRLLLDGWEEEDILKVLGQLAEEGITEFEGDPPLRWMDAITFKTCDQ